MGAQAITFCHLAAGRTDAVVGPASPSRSVDFAAAQLLVRERGFAIAAIDGPELGTIPLDLTARSRICAAAGTPELAAQLAASASARCAPASAPPERWSRHATPSSPPCRG